MNLLFITDPLAGFKLDKDSSLAMMRQAQQRGHTVWVCGTPDLQWQRGGRVSAVMQRLRLKDPENDWYHVEETHAKALCEMDAVLMRKDPPFDNEFIYSTYILERAEQRGSLIVNKPQSLRDCNEKVFATQFPQCTPPVLVTRLATLLREFHAEHGDVIFKPLDGMGGSSIFRLKAGDPNVSVIIETLTNHGKWQIMAQKFIPEITQGDKRILMIDGQHVGYALARIPAPNETRGNLAAGGRGVARALSDRDREIAQTLAPILFSRGLLLVGLDVIGDNLTEINVTSPTCFREITAQTGFDVAALFVDSLERAVSGEAGAAGSGSAARRLTS